MTNKTLRCSVVNLMLCISERSLDDPTVGPRGWSKDERVKGRFLPSKKGPGGRGELDFDDETFELDEDDDDEFFNEGDKTDSLFLTLIATFPDGYDGTPNTEAKRFTDEQFEKTMEEYDDDDLGYLSEVS